jgi:hypothetical protein
MATSKKETSLEIAQRLRKIQEDLDELEMTYKEAKTPYEEAEKLTKEELVEAMQKERRSRTATLPDGYAYNLITKTLVKVTDEKKALEYATANYAIRVDLDKIRSLVKRQLQTPEGFTLVESRHPQKVLVETGEEDDKIIR